MDVNEFSIDDIFEILGQGIVVTGRVLSGRIRPGMKTKILGQEVLLKKIETFRGTLDSAKTDEIVGLLLEGINGKEDLKRGETLIFD